MIHCTFENGRETSLRHITVGAIAINDSRQVLLVKRDSRIHNGNKYTIPGGFLDRDENTKEAVLRELKEETGYVGEIEALFQINDNPKRPKEDRQNVDFLFIVKILGGEKTLSDEVSEISWFDKEDLPEDEDFAFDHRAIILRYFDYLDKPFALPFMGGAL